MSNLGFKTQKHILKYENIFDIFWIYCKNIPLVLTVGSLTLSGGSRFPENEVIAFGAASSEDVTDLGAARAGARSKTVLT